jgi:hypothetical protein
VQPIAEKEAVKAAVRQRDGYCCTGCGMCNQEHLKQFGQSLHVHRLKPGSLYTVDGCQSLCSKCHGRAIKRAPGDPELTTVKPPVIIRLHEDLRKGLDALAARNASTVTSEIRIAIREYLEAEGLWPPKQADGTEGEG